MVDLAIAPHSFTFEKPVVAPVGDQLDNMAYIPIR